MIVYDTYIAYTEITPNGQIYYYLKYKIDSECDINSLEYSIDNDYKIPEGYQIVVIPRFCL